MVPSSIGSSYVLPVRLSVTVSDSAPVPSGAFASWVCCSVAITLLGVRCLLGGGASIAAKGFRPVAKPPGPGGIDETRPRAGGGEPPWRPRRPPAPGPAPPSPLRPPPNPSGGSDSRRGRSGRQPLRTVSSKRSSISSRVSRETRSVPNSSTLKEASTVP